MTQKKNFWILLLIFIIALFGAALVFPKHTNQGIDFLKEKSGINIPNIPDISFRLGLDLQGGTHLVYDADVSSIEQKDRRQSMEGLRDIIERRVNLFGVQEPIVQIQETDDRYRLIVELAGVKDSSEAIKMIGETPFLEFKLERNEEERNWIIERQEELMELSEEDLKETEDLHLIFENPYFVSTNLTGKYLKRADLDFDQATFRPIVQLHFDDEGAEIFKELTSQNIGKQIAIYIDDVLLSAPVVQQEIAGGRAQITGDFDVNWARDLVRNLNAGALPVPIELISQQSIGPTLGAVSLEKSLLAGIYGFLAIIIFMIIFYKVPGILAAISLAIYVIFFLSIIKLVPMMTLTLAGIGGIILSIGMAVDANILIFSRIREELKQEKGFRTAIEEGFRRSWPSIRDGNLTTLIVALILYSFGTSFIKGFAFTLSFGIVLSMFTAFVVTKSLMRAFSGTKLEKFKQLWT